MLSTECDLPCSLWAQATFFIYRMPASKAAEIDPLKSHLIQTAFEQTLLVISQKNIPENILSPSDDSTFV